jgi:hypothetical protein
MKWLTRVAIVVWLLLTALCLYGFVFFAYFDARSIFPSSFIERHDATTCPGYGERDDPELAECIHLARQVATRRTLSLMAISRIVFSDAQMLDLPFGLLLIWGSVKAVRRIKKALAT